jgi:hypothetical protein
MRYTLTVMLAGIAIATAVPAALAENNSGRGCYWDGVAFSCTPPSPVYLRTGPNQETVQAPISLLPGNEPALEIHRASSPSYPLVLRADSGFAIPPTSPAPGYNPGYGNVVEPFQPLWVVQFPL